MSRFSRRGKIKFPVLSDEKSEVIRAFGVFNDNYAPNSYAHGVAVPIIVVLGADGAVTHRFSTADYTERTDIDSIVSVLGKK